MGRVLKQTVLTGGVVYPAGTPEADVNGDVPDKFWDGASVADDAAGGEGYDAKSADYLKAEADRRDLEVTGTGKDGKVLKKDLVAALEADDAAGGEG